MVNSKTTYENPIVFLSRKLERERDELREWASVNGVSSLAKDRDQFRAQLREEQQLHIQTLNERDALRFASSTLKNAKGRFHTEQAAINLFNLLP